MRSTALILSFGTGAILVQTTLLRLTPVGAVIPDLVLVLSVYLGLHYQRVGGVLGAFVLGYMLDTFSGTDLGVNAFAMTVVFLFVYLLSRRLWIEGSLPNILVVLAGAVVKTLTIMVLVSVSSGPLLAATVRNDILGGVVSAVMAPMVFGSVERAKRWLRLA